MILFDLIKLKLRFRRETAALEGWIAMGARQVALEQAAGLVRARKLDRDTFGLGVSTAFSRVEDDLSEMIEETKAMKEAFADRIQRARRR